MGLDNFIQKSELLSFKGTRCLRNAYYHNDCTLCIDLCPKDAFEVIRNKIILDSKSCNDCAVCIGICPTEAISIENFDPNEFTVRFSETDDSLISCKKNSSCLSAFDKHHFISMALRNEAEITCDMSLCEECELNKDETVEKHIRENIAHSNKFFEDSNVKIKINTKEYIDDENDRRAMFKEIFSKTKEKLQEGEEEPAITELHQAKLNSKLPLKHTILKNSIKLKLDLFENKTMSDTLFTEKIIDFQKCINCSDCVQFCPTEALVATSDKQGINIIYSSCTSCGICDDICKSNAITSKENYDLVNIVYDRGTTLVHYDMVVCQECKCPFPYKGGEPICDRCEDFTVNFTDMFTMAKDI
ncbi:MAG: 4Fe-4S dicluster domain-containing protein [Helicobacteraceae bacterium]|nr:4Fe-4S dicluster domain-containing protein [Helicobacteraceae bacterium]